MPGQRPDRGKPFHPFCLELTVQGMKARLGKFTYERRGHILFLLRVGNKRRVRLFRIPGENISAFFPDVAVKKDAGDLESRFRKLGVVDKSCKGIGPGKRPLKLSVDTGRRGVRDRAWTFLFLDQGRKLAVFS